MAFCMNCGQKLVTGARFCMSCGTPVPAGAAEAAQPEKRIQFTSLNCPRCSAPLQVDAGFTSATCKYCGNSFVVEDVVKTRREAGFAYEQGRMEALTFGTAKVAEKVKSLMGPILELEQLKLSCQTGDQEMARIHGRIADLSKPTLKILLWIAGGLSMALGIVSAAAGGGPVGFLVGLLFLGVFILAGFLSQKYAEAMKGKEEQKLENVEALQKSRRDRMEQIEKENDVGFIPPEYRTEDAMKYFYTALTDQRAISLPQAIALYREELHHREIYEMQQEQIRLQQEQLKTQQAQMATAKIKTKHRDEEDDDDDDDIGEKIAGKVIGSIVTTGIGIAIGRGIGKFFDEL